MPALRGCPNCTGNGVARTKVHYHRIMEAFTDRGLFGPDIRDLARETQDLAEIYAPVRTGKMKKAHYRVILPPRGYTRDFMVGNKMGYAPFVQHGTKGNGTGYIMAKPPRMMELRPIPYSWFRPDSPGRFQAAVKGQKGFDWLKMAMIDAVKFRMKNSPRRPGR